MPIYTLNHNVTGAARNTGLARAAAAYNLTLPAGVTPLTPEQYLYTVAAPEIDRWLDSYADLYTVTLIPKDEFLDRLPRAKVKALLASTNADTKSFLALLPDIVNITKKRVKDDVADLVTAGEITQNQADNLLAI